MKTERNTKKILYSKLSIASAVHEKSHRKWETCSSVGTYFSKRLLLSIPLEDTIQFHIRDIRVSVLCTRKKNMKTNKKGKSIRINDYCRNDSFFSHLFLSNLSHFWLPKRDFFNVSIQVWTNIFADSTTKYVKIKYHFRAKHFPKRKMNKERKKKRKKIERHNNWQENKGKRRMEIIEWKWKGSGRERNRTFRTKSIHMSICDRLNSKQAISNS